MRLPAFNLIEAFDQPWKRKLEGAMGGYWGHVHSRRRAAGEPPWAGVADPQWWHMPLACSVGGAAGLLWGLGRASRQLRRRNCGADLAAGGMAPLALLQWQQLLQWNRTPLDWAFGGGVLCAVRR